jgi:hypothetical protein
MQSKNGRTYSKLDELINQISFKKNGEVAPYKNPETNEAKSWNNPKHESVLPPTRSLFDPRALYCEKRSNLMIAPIFYIA